MFDVRLVLLPGYAWCGHRTPQGDGARPVLVVLVVLLHGRIFVDMLFVGAAIARAHAL